MECTLEQGDEISLNGFLESTDGGGLESEIGLEVLGNFPDETLEGEFADQELSRFLVTTDLTEGDCTGAITMGLLDTSGCGGGFSGSLGGELFARGFATSRLTGSLLCAGHWMCCGWGVVRQRRMWLVIMCVVEMIWRMWPATVFIPWLVQGQINKINNK
jgi:hypothetical protein